MASEKSTECIWTPDKSDNVPLIIGTNERQKNNWDNHFQAKTFILYLLIVLFFISLIGAIFYFVYTDPKCDGSRYFTAEQSSITVDDEIGDSCGPLFTCNYYLNTPCKATCWHNTWDIRDRECQKMGSFDCRWSFAAPTALFGGRCYCCDLKCGA